MIKLTQIDETNFLECFALRLGNGQERFVSSPIRSLAQAYVYRDQCMPFGIYAGDKMIGYVMVIYDREEQTYNIWHFMIDAAHQRKGYGKAALAQAIR
ncbi:MAG TPA: GNAT family N-acetyltransferase [Gemmiger formicilis]|nr:GNAT family N-acetyltransferase [Gemmiger formicilis]